MTDTTIALAVVAAEIGEPLDALAARLGTEVMLGPAGVRHIDAGLAERLITEHRAEQRAKREREQRRHEQATARARERSQLLHDRIRAIQARQQIDVDGDLSKSALATLTAHDIAAKPHAPPTAWTSSFPAEADTSATHSPMRSTDYAVRAHRITEVHGTADVRRNRTAAGGDRTPRAAGIRASNLRADRQDHRPRRLHMRALPRFDRRHSVGLLGLRS